MNIRYISIVAFLFLVASHLLNCESPTKPKRDAPLDVEGENYQVPDTPSVISSGQNVNFGESYTVSWNEVERANQYIVEESIDSLFVSAVTDTVSGTSQDFHHYVNSLTQFFYRVKGINGEYKGDWSNTVDIIINQLDTPQLSSKNETIISGNEYSITWAVVDSAQSYILQESTNNSFTNALEVTSDSTSYKTSHTIESPTIYYYRIKALNGEYMSGWSNTVEVIINPPIPTAPVLETPVVHWDNIIVNWDAVSFATSYTIEESDNNSFTDAQSYEIGNTTSYVFSSDVSETKTFYYRVKADGISGTSDWSNTLECIMVPFELVLTVSENEVFSEDDFTLNWNDVDASSYTIEEATNINFNNATSISVSGTIKSFNYYSETQQTYYYRLRAHSGNITSDWSNSIEVVITPPAPSAPFLSEPVVNQNSVTVSWEKVKYATSYTLESAENSNFTDANLFEIETTTSKTFSYNISESTTFYYRVKALGLSGSSSWSNLVTVTIKPVKHELILEINPSGSGATEPPTGSYIYNENTVVTITASPMEGYRFVSWTGDVADKNSSSTTVTMSGDKTVTANFEEIPATSQEIALVSIPAGTFQMGSDDGGDNEKPVHTVTLDYSFEMSQTEITQEQYETIMGENPSSFSGTNLPVETVSWYDAVTFCNNLSSSEGLQPCYNLTTWECDFSKNGYRLPTDAEWEYACRAGTTTKYYTGNSESDLARAGWYPGNSTSTHPVRDKEPNKWNSYDMHGNVIEWCNDRYDEKYYSYSSSHNPIGSSTGTARIRRGGSYDDAAIGHRSACRSFSQPGYSVSRIGFRVVSGAFTPGYSISGTITGASGVTVTLSGDTDDSKVVTTNGGSYSFTVVYGGSYNVTPSKEGYMFIPTSQTFNNMTSAQTQDFFGSQIIEFQDITFVSIPGGQFPMGDTEGVGDADEKPVHAVTLSPFEMSAYEITTEQYVQFLNEALKSGDITFSDLMSVKGAHGECSGKEYINLYYTSGENYNITYLDGVFFVVSGFEKWPMMYVTWYGAKGFALYYGADLPTEAEWEYTCRGKKQYKYGTDDGTISSAKANYDYNFTGKHSPVDVGKYPANPLGLYDMSGNVWEWCHDWYGSYTSENVTNPTGAQTGSNRVKRGGSARWSNRWPKVWPTGDCRSANRNSNDPSYRDNYLGFRVVRRPGGVTY